MQKLKKTIMSKNYWIHRISHLSEISHPMLNDGYLTYGYSDFAILDNYIDNVKTKGWEYLEQIKISVMALFNRYENR